MSTEFTLDSNTVHYTWNSGIAPRIAVRSGDIVTLQIRGGGDNYYTKASTHADIAGRQFRGHPLTGPILVEAAHPGSVLRVEIVGVTPADWGYTWVAPGYGILSDELVRPFLKIWDLSDGLRARFNDAISIPIEPFLGVIGVAPREAGDHETTPPRRMGGNLDIKQLTAGSTVWLPVEVEGALFSAGDAHAAQGDGEVGISAIEIGATATVRLVVEQDRELRTPEFRTGGPLTPRTNEGDWFATTGVAPDLMVAARDAVRAMVTYLSREHGLGFEEALCLCSVCVDLKISEVVDRPNWVVSAFLPLSIFQ